jgi:hypothetical protein
MQFVLRHRLMVAIIGSGVALLVIAAVGLYGLLRRPEPTVQPDQHTKDGAVSSWPPTIGDPQIIDQPHPVVQTRDAELFVRGVASSLFDWDTRHDGGPSDWAQPLVDAAAADEAPAVASDVRSYLPSNEMWDQLSAYGTQQWLEISSVAVPDTWSAALAQATPGQIPRGAVAYTVSGTRHRSGSWGAEPVQSERAVAFTVFAVCPTLENCTLLRLSQLDRPLK